MIKGIDVASYQSETFPTSGLDFVFVKATEGTTYINPKQGRQAATARNSGLVLGFYHFLHPGNVVAQAAYFVDKCASLEGDLLVCDWETTGTGGRPTNAEKDAFIREVKRLRPTHRVGLYANTDYWLHRDSTGYAGDFLWIADPNAKAGAPRIQAKWLFHQHSITGGTDQNVADFKDRAALRAWAGGKPPATPKPTVEQRLADVEQRVATLEATVKKLSTQK